MLTSVGKSARKSLGLQDSRLLASEHSSFLLLFVVVCFPCLPLGFFPVLPPKTHPSTNFPSPRTADLVQDLYLRELKSYKVPQVKASDSEGHVQKFNPPKPPQSPEETDIAKELQAYEASTVEVEGQAEGGAEAKELDWFEEEPEEEGAHH
jgi:F-type H+-transporting ATPase subunit h